MTGLGLDGVLPVIGSKELIAVAAAAPGPRRRATWSSTPSWPTRRTRWARRWPAPRAVATDSLTALGPERPALLWLNSPSNPTGRVLPPDHLRKVVDWCRERGTILVTDECYLECAWEGEPVSVLHPDVCGGSPRGDPRRALALEAVQPGRLPLRASSPATRRWSAELLAVRKNLGLMQPGPQQVAMAAALADDAHARGAARALRRPPGDAARGARGAPASGSTTPRRRSTCGPPATRTAGTPSPARRPRHPGRSRHFYGRAGARHVRVALTATDERIDAAVARLAA